MKPDSVKALLPPAPDSVAARQGVFHPIAREIPWRAVPSTRDASKIVLPRGGAIRYACAMNRRNSIIAGLAGMAAATVAPHVQAQDKAANPELDDIRALLKAHDEAMTGHDLKGVLATMTEKASIMGTGPGEIWTGTEEIKVAYDHFFQGFDKGEQHFDYQFKIGGLGADMGWLMASGNIKGKKGGKAFEFPINISLTVAKAGGKWQIASMHFSTLTGDGGSKASE